MSALTLNPASLPAIHRQFEAELPRIDKVLSFEFRRWPPRRRAEAVADARAAAWAAWRGLLARGQDPVEVGPPGIARNAARYVKAGRRLGTGSCGRGAMDVYHPRARRRSGLKLVSLDHDPGAIPGEESDGWRDWLASDNRCTPADEACFRLDFAGWLEGLPPRKRALSPSCRTPPKRPYDRWTTQVSSPPYRHRTPGTLPPAAP